ncbi:response regulator [Sphingobacteriaceae bacterium]|nr:response regulator [Sphingobacteriaceae bacterium]
MQYQTILLIDDDVEDQEIFTNALSKVSDLVQCVCFTNARTALEKLKAKELNPDIIFLDLNMPIMNGREFLTLLKNTEALKEIPVIIFSTSASPTTIKETRDLGAKDFITKPNRFDQLVEILKPIIN